MQLRSVHRNPFVSFSYDNQFSPSWVRPTGKHDYLSPRTLKHSECVWKAATQTLRNSEKHLLFSSISFVVSTGMESDTYLFPPHCVCLTADQEAVLWGRSDGMWSCDLDTSLSKRMNGTKGSSTSTLESAALCGVRCLRRSNSRPPTR